MNFHETLIKEADEEIGIEVEVIDSLPEFLKASKNLTKPLAYFFDKFLFKTPKNNEFVGLAFILTPSTTLNFKDKEVVDFRWLAPKELKNYLKENNNYCEPLPLVFEKAEKFRKKYISFDNTFPIL